MWYRQSDVLVSGTSINSNVPKYYFLSSEDSSFLLTDVYNETNEIVKRLLFSRETDIYRLNDKQRG